MSGIAGLQEPYIQVRRKETGVITYGGDQNFFKGAAYGTEDEQKQRLGCGITALGDLFLYLAGHNREYRTRENECYVNHILLQNEYKSYYNDIYKFVGKFRKGAKSGLSGLRLQNRFNRMARQNGWKLRGRWGLSAKRLYDRILEMLEKDLPVILCIPMMLGSGNKEQGVFFYKRNEEKLCRDCRVSAHYVVITGVIKEDEDIYLKISSWGKEYYVNWKEFDRLIRTQFLGTILGNILYIR